MASMAGLMGVPVDFEFEGTVYKVAPRTLELEGYFERWLEDQGLKAIQRHRSTFSADEYQLQMDGWRRDCSAGDVYAYDGEISRRSRRSVAGVKYLAFLQLGAMNKGVDMHLIDRIDKDAAATERLLEAMARASGEYVEPVPQPAPPDEPAAAPAGQ